MKKFSALTLLCALLLPIHYGCSETVDPGEDALTVPPVYSFESRFEPGTVSVSYSGQTVRNLLMQDLTSLISAQSGGSARELTLDDLLLIYEHSDAGNLSTTTSTGATPALERSYSAISTNKKLSDKVAPMELFGTGLMADAQLRAWFDSIVAFSSDPARRGTPMAYTTDAGLDLSQLVDKVMLGSIAYYQGTTYYLGELTTKNNSEASGTNPYTSLEHSWDEAFGYFGAARDYDRFTDAMLAGSADDFSFDTNGDKAIDFRSEYNFPFARNAGKRDAGSGTGTDFSGEIFRAFRTGRAVIAAEGSQSDLLVQRTIVARTWERVIGATVIHYINEVVSDIEGLDESATPSNQPDLNKHWAEMKGYLWALGFNSLGSITPADLGSWHTTVGAAPRFEPAGSVGATQYRAGLISVRDALGTRLGFLSADIAAW